MMAGGGGRAVRGGEHRSEREEARAMDARWMSDKYMIGRRSRMHRYEC